MDRVKAYVKAARVQFLTATLVPVLVGTATAFREEGRVSLDLLLLTLLAMGLIHLGANMANDYYDHLSGADDINPAPLAPLAGGSRAIQEGLLPAQAVFRGAVLLLALGVVLGAVLAMICGPLLLLLGAFGALTAFFYTAPPLRLGYRGVGEVIIALDFGVLPVLGAFYVQTGRVSPGAFLSSLPVAFLVAAILWVNEIPDIPYDRRAGKFTLVARLGPKRAKGGLSLLFLGAFLSLIFLSAFEGEPLLLLPLVAFPLGIYASMRAWRDFSRPEFLGPACRATILTHLLVGVFLSLSLWL